MCLPTCVAAGQVRIAERSSYAIAERFRLFFPIAVRPLAAGVELHSAHAAFAAGQAERDDDPVADLQPLVFPAHLDDLPHAFVAEDVAGLHFRNKSAHQMEVGAADRAGRHLEDGVTSIFDPGVGALATAGRFLALWGLLVGFGFLVAVLFDLVGLAGLRGYAVVDQFNQLSRIHALNGVFGIYVVRRDEER